MHLILIVKKKAKREFSYLKAEVNVVFARFELN